MNDKTCISTTYITPPRILDPVREYFHGAIDFDPMTEPDNPTGAMRFETEETDGLRFNCPWNGRVFVNPPYGKQLRPALDKLCAEAGSGAHVLALLPGQRFEQLYYQQKVFNWQLTAYCMVRKRVNFLRPDGTKAKGNPYGSFLFLYNGDWTRFRQAFGTIGLCIRPELHTRVTS